VAPRMPDSPDAVLISVATLWTTLAPWGLAFVQSHAVDQHLHVGHLHHERVDVITGAVRTGVLGFFVVVACAATLQPAGVTIEDGADAAQGLERLSRREAVVLVAMIAAIAVACLVLLALGIGLGLG
jgi:Mn2+/Fe2+ NRAMP family transporter